MTEEKQPEPEKPVIQEPKMGVMHVSITLKYEDGFETTNKSPDMIGYRPSEMSMLTPNQRPAMVKIVNMDALKKAMGIIQEAMDAVEQTIPSDEDIAKAKREIAAQQAAAEKNAGPIQIPGGPPRG